MRNKYEALSTYELKSLLYHLAEAGLWDMVLRVYVDLELAEAVFERGASDRIIEDYSLTLTGVKPHTNTSDLTAIQAHLDFIRSEFDYLKQFPGGVMQQAENQPDDSPVHKAAVSLLESANTGERPRVRWINKASSVGPLLLRLRGHTNWIACCAWVGADQVLSAGDDKEIKVWNIGTGNLVSSVTIPNARPLCYSPDGKLLLAHNDKQVMIVDAETGAPTGQTITIRTSIKSCAWSEDSRRIAIAGDEGGLIVWNLDTGRRKRLAPKVTSKCVAWSPDGRYIALGSHPLFVWDLQSGKRVGKLGDARWVVQRNTHTWTTFKGHKQGANACAWSPDGRYIATGGGHGFGSYDNDFSVRVWDSKSFEEIVVLMGHQDRVTSLKWSRDSRWLASTSGSVMTPGEDNSVRIWDMTLLRPHTTLRGHTNEVVSCCWSSDAQRLVSISKDKTLIVWDARKSGNAPELVTGIYPSVDGKQAALAHEDHSVAIINVHSGDEQARFSSHKDEITMCAWSPDNLFLTTGSLDRTAILWDLEKKKQLAVLRAHSGDVTYTAGGHRVVWGAINDIAWSPDGELFATAGSDRLLVVWSRRQLGEYRTLLGHIGPIDRCRWSLDGKRLISEGGSFEHIVDEATLLWDVQRGCELGRLSSDDPELESFKEINTSRLFRRDDVRTVNSLNGLGVVRVKEDTWQRYDVKLSHAAVKKVWKMKIDGSVHSVVWFPDGRHVLIVVENLIRMLDTVGQRELVRFAAQARFSEVLTLQGGQRVLAIDEAGLLYILSVEGLEFETSAMKVTARWSARARRWQKYQYGCCPICGSSVRVARIVDVTSCRQCKSRIQPVFAKELVHRDSLIPLDQQNGESWLRLIRGLIINRTADDNELAMLYRSLADLEPDAVTFSSAIHDPYGETIEQINAALWQTGAFVLWGDEVLVEKFLRTALLHWPGDEKTKGYLACVLLISGKEPEASKLIATIPSDVMGECINDVVEFYMRSGIAVAKKHLIEFAAHLEKGKRRKRST